MRLRIRFAGVAAWLIGAVVQPVYVDLDDTQRQRVLREADYQARADEQSKVLRVSGRRLIAGPLKRLRAI